MQRSLEGVRPSEAQADQGSSISSGGRGERRLQSWLIRGGHADAQVNMHEARTHRSRLVEEAASWASRLRISLPAGHCQVPDDFDQLAAAEIADLFERR
ncbi:MAG: hypothetical protein VKI83_05440 [Synechococcaceae cyanobacterium]|nr:hypothetical protein [Synechococcaceae cyanobacterium]